MSDPVFPTSQGTTATFAGFRLGGLVKFRSMPASCSPEDITPLSALTVGTGEALRVIRVFHSGPIVPGTASVEVLGIPVFAHTDIGMIGDLDLVGGSGWFVSFPAILTKVEISGGVGDLVRTSMEFQYR